MRKHLLFFALVLFIAMVSAPQTFGQIEVFGGYSYLHVNNTANTGSNANGWDASLSTHLIGPLGAEVDYSDHYGISPANANGQYVPELSQLYGPRFTFLTLPRIEPFVHALFGAVNGVAEVPSPILCPGPLCSPTTTKQDAFTVAFGGGLNVKATRHVWVRLIQVDYFRINFSGNPQNDTRISAGLVLRFGRW